MHRHHLLRPKRFCGYPCRRDQHAICRAHADIACRADIHAAGVQGLCRGDQTGACDVGIHYDVFPGVGPAVDFAGWPCVDCRRDGGCPCHVLQHVGEDRRGRRAVPDFASCARGRRAAGRWAMARDRPGPHRRPRQSLDAERLDHRTGGLAAGDDQPPHAAAAHPGFAQSWPVSLPPLPPRRHGHAPVAVPRPCSRRRCGDR